MSEELDSGLAWTRTGGDSDSDVDPIARLQSARSEAPVQETEQALARLESVLFGGKPSVPSIDRYPLLRKLGSGGGGVVYLADDPKLDRMVAIKVLHERRTDRHGRGRARLLREARLMAGSPHPNIVSVFDVGLLEDERDPGVFVVMEYAEGPNLHEWLRRPHTWQEVLRVFLAAGQGLAAAHDVGVVHRDFKPANVILTPSDGPGGIERVRVLDFGLAYEADEEALVTPGTTDSMPRITAERLTDHDAVLGTPAYMAPEQHIGAVADAAADQFAFCVALWEGLVGKRPYRGRSMTDMAHSKAAGPPARPRKSDAPPRLFDVLRRGMAPVPDDRWPSMQALLDALEASRHHRRRRVALVGALILPIAVMSVAFGSGAHDERCTGGEASMGEVWNAERRAGLETSFTNTGLSTARAAAARVADRVDGIVMQWSEAHHDVCEASQGGDGAEETLDRAMLCLERQRQRLDALLVVLEDADRTLVTRAVTAVSKLPQPKACTDADRLDETLPPPDDPDLAARVAALRRDDQRVWALIETGRSQEAADLASVLVIRAEETGHPPVLAEVLHTRGMTERVAGRPHDAVESHTRAHELATSCNHDRIAADSAIELTFLFGNDLPDLDAARTWGATANAILTRRGVKSGRFHLWVGLGAAHRAAGQFDEALRYQQQALDEADRPLERAVALNNLGHTALNLHDFDAAHRYFTASLPLWYATYPEGHHDVATAINNLGVVELVAGNPIAAELRYRETLLLREQILGPKHPQVASVLSNLGIVLRRVGRLAEARECYERGLAIYDALPDEDIDGLSSALNGLAQLESIEENHEAALRLLDRTVVLLEQHLGPEHPDLAGPLQNRAMELVWLGDLRAADSNRARAQEIMVATFGADHPRAAEATLDYAKVLEAVGGEQDAVPLVADALAQLDGSAHPEARDALAAWLEAHGQGYPDPSDL